MNYLLVNCVFFHCQHTEYVSKREINVQFKTNFYFLEMKLKLNVFELELIYLPPVSQTD